MEDLLAVDDFDAIPRWDGREYFAEVCVGANEALYANEACFMAREELMRVFKCPSLEIGFHSFASHHKRAAVQVTKTTDE